MVRRLRKFSGMTVPRWRISRLKRGLAVSTVIANLAMIAITLALAATLIVWAGTTYGTFSSNSGLFFLQRGQALQERFVVENIFFNRTGANHNIMLFVRNVGVQDIKLAAIYVNGTSPSTYETGGSLCPGSFPVQLVVGAVCEFNFLQGSTQWASGTIFNIVVTSTMGNRATFVASGP